MFCGPASNAVPLSERTLGDRVRLRSEPPFRRSGERSIDFSVKVGVQAIANKSQDRGSSPDESSLFFVPQMVAESHISPRSERVQVAMEEGGGSRRVKIRIESFDEKLGWYSSGALTLGLEQLPLVEQAIAEMRQIERARQQTTCEIIPFPPLAAAE
jgi:hypothetical protein